MSNNSNYKIIVIVKILIKVITVIIVKVIIIKIVYNSKNSNNRI